MSNVILPNLGAVNRLITDASPQPTLFSTLYSLGLTIKTDHLTNEMFDSPNPRAERLPTPAPAPRIPTYPRPSAPGAYQARELRGSRPRDGGNLESLHPASSANRNLDMDLKHDFAETEVGFLLLPPHLEQSSSAHGHAQSLPPTRPALSTLMGGRIDLSRLSFQHYLEPSKRLTISGPDLLFEPKDLAGANASSLLLDCRSAEELSHGRLWKVFQAKICGVDKDQFEYDPDHTTVVMDGAKGETSLAKGEGEGEDDIIKCLTSVRAKPRSSISAISSDLGNARQGRVEAGLDRIKLIRARGRGRESTRLRPGTSCSQRSRALLWTARFTSRCRRPSLSWSLCRFDRIWTREVLGDDT